MTNEILLSDIEKIVHPLVSSERQIFYDQKSSEGNFLVLFDIPLLYENYNKYNDLDYIIVASADSETQLKRVLARPGMTYEKFQSILSKQVPDEEKRKRADFIVQTNYPGFSESKSQVATIIETIITKHPIQFKKWLSNLSTKTSLQSISDSLTGNRLITI